MSTSLPVFLIFSSTVSKGTEASTSTLCCSRLTVYDVTPGVNVADPSYAIRYVPSSFPRTRSIAREQAPHVILTSKWYLCVFLYKWKVNTYVGHDARRSSDTKCATSERPVSPRGWLMWRAWPATRVCRHTMT